MGQAYATHSSCRSLLDRDGEKFELPCLVKVHSNVDLLPQGNEGGSAWRHIEARAAKCANRLRESDYEEIRNKDGHQGR